MLVDVAGDGDVAADAVGLDGESTNGLAASAFCFGCSPYVEAFTAWRYFDVVRWVVVHECGCRFGEFSAGDAVVEVDAADSVAEDVSESDAGC